MNPSLTDRDVLMRRMRTHRLAGRRHPAHGTLVGAEAADVGRCLGLRAAAKIDDA